MNLTQYSLLALACAFSGSPGLFGGETIEYPAIQVGQRPESVTRGFEGDLFVTVMGNPGPDDGVVMRVRGQEISLFATGLDEPKGIAFVGDSLVASDLNRVVRINNSGELFVLAGPEAFPHEVLYLNDVAAAPDGKGVYVTDMGDRTNMWQSPGVFTPLDSDTAKAMRAVGRVYHVALDGTVTEVLKPSRKMINPNGVGVGKDGQLLVGAFFNGYLLELRGQQLHVVADGMRGADAVEQDAAGNYYVSSWNQGKVWKVSPDGTKTLIAEGFETAADFYLDEKKGILYLPDMAAGKLYVLKL